MFRHILVPVDFTRKNLAALKAAATLAKGRSTRVTLLHVIEKVDYLSSRELKRFYSKLEENAKKKITRTGDVFDGIEIDQRIVYGKRAEEIVRYAAQNEVDLVILTSHRVMRGSGFGGVSHTVAILSPCSVLLVK